MLATLERQGCRQSSARRLWPTGVGRTPESISNIERGKQLPYMRHCPNGKIPVRPNRQSSANALTLRCN